MTRFWHRHRPDPAASYLIGGTYRCEKCRCGLQRMTWLDRGLPWWQSTWADGLDVTAQLRRVRSEAPAGVDR